MERTLEDLVEDQDWSIYSETMEILASWDPTDEQWNFTGSPGSTFLFVFSDQWSDEKDTSYYVDFWEPVMKELEAFRADRTPTQVELGEPVPVHQPGPVQAEIEMKLTLWHGILERELTAMWMEKWRTDKVVCSKPNTLTVEQHEGDLIVVGRCQIESFEVRPLSAINL